MQWDAAAHEVGELYESFWYRHSDLRGEWLFGTKVTDSSGWCRPGSIDYIDHTINKQTSSSNYQVSDDFWPYYTNNGIGAQTYHGMTTGDSGITYCTSWNPFY